MKSSVQHRTYSINVCWTEGVIPRFHLYAVHTHNHTHTQPHTHTHVFSKSFQPVLIRSQVQSMPLMSNCSVGESWWEGEGGLGGRETAGHKLAQHSALSIYSRTLRGSWYTWPTPISLFQESPTLFSGTPYLWGIIFSEIKPPHSLVCTHHPSAYGWKDHKACLLPL